MEEGEKGDERIAHAREWDGEIIVLVKRWAQGEAGGEATQRLSSFILFLNPYVIMLSTSLPRVPFIQHSQPTSIPHWPPTSTCI